MKKLTIKIDDKLTLELVQDNHIQPLFELANRNREFLGKWLTWVEEMKDSDFIENFIRWSTQRNLEGTEFAFVIIEEQKMVGRIGVYKIDQVNRIGEIGYWVGEEYEGKGIVIRCCRKLIEFSFYQLALNRIEIKCATDNLKSLAIPEKLKFKREGVLREAKLFNGDYKDLVVFSMLKIEFHSTH